MARAVGTGPARVISRERTGTAAMVSRLRADDRRRRADEILGRAEAVVPADHHVGVYLALPVASWAEPD
ncbi:hypothetical protein [Nocardia farcinica]|uniref:hypothetical protein n=1 Tax=Nocardia farcinica TaxID=37329 RepID=UPI0037AFF26F